MSAVNYITLKDIRVEAGMQNREHDQEVSGDVDGVNTDFYTNQTPLVDRGGDDLITVSDVTAFVDGSAVPISVIEPLTGLVRLQSAPDEGQSVTIDYVWSPVDDELMTDLRIEAISWVNRRVKKYIDLTTITADNFPPEWRTAARLWAGAMIIIRDYGSGTDTDGSSKDGYKKLGAAKSVLQDWIDDYSGTNNEEDAVAPTGPTVVSDGNIFPRSTDLSNDFGGCDPELQFHNKRC